MQKYRSKRFERHIYRRRPRFINHGFYDLLTNITSDRVIISLLFIAAILFVTLDAPNMFETQKAWALTNRFVPYELALTNFVKRSESKGTSSSLLDLPTIKMNPMKAWGGRVPEMDLINTNSNSSITSSEIHEKAIIDNDQINSSKPCNISSPFGYRRLGRSVRHHDGIDVSMPYGRPILAHEDGIVSFAGWKSGYGNLVILDHGYGKQTFYAHASYIRVKVGDNIKEGEAIANVGATGRAFGTHLHFEIRYNGVPVDPEQEFLSKKLYF